MVKCTAELLNNPTFIKAVLPLVLANLAAKYRISPDELWREHSFAVCGSIVMAAKALALRLALREHWQAYLEIVSYFSPVPNQEPIKHSPASVMACKAFKRICHLEAFSMRAAQVGLTVPQVMRLYLEDDAETIATVKLQIFRRCISFTEAVNQDSGFGGQHESQQLGLTVVTSTGKPTAISTSRPRPRSKPKRTLRLSTLVLLVILLVLLLWVLS